MSAELAAFATARLNEAEAAAKERHGIWPSPAVEAVSSVPGTLPAPLGVWDTRDAAMRCRWDAAVAWAEVNLPDAWRTYRAEFHLIDGPFAVVYRFTADADGNFVAVPGTCEPATDEPVIVPLAELPPAGILTP